MELGELFATIAFGASAVVAAVQRSVALALAAGGLFLLTLAGAIKEF